jgi:hypothetical protein
MNTFSINDFPDISTFTKYKEKDDFTFDNGMKTSNIHADFFEKDEAGQIISVGLFSYKGKELFCAWGYKDEEHCSMHAVITPDGTWSQPQQGCPIKTALIEKENLVGLLVPTTEGDISFYFA